jgi:TonB-linked SusC/RagA family outer membrane protein
MTLPLAARAQTREITGKVVEVGSETPLTEATIGILGSQLGVRTNERGEFRLKIPSGGATVLARAIGFKRQTIEVNATQTTVNFTLEKDVLELEGVTVTGQATTVDKRNASTAVATVSAEELTKVPSKSVEGELAGKVVGTSVYENSGVPGGGMQVQIRGATSILASGDPLYVVDGVLVSNQSVQGGLASISRSSGTSNSSQDQTVNRLADLNPDDIESIEVLKSAAATAIYGSRATNGVVVITTKKGKPGPAHYNITQRMGSQQATRLLGSRQFTSYAQVQQWLGGSPHADSLAQANCTPVCPYYDWQGELYNNNKPSFETLFSTSGGANNTRYYGSISDRQTKGVLQNSGARLTSGRANLDQTIGDKITLSIGVDVAHNFTQDGIGNNDNSGISPIYTFGYAPAIYDLRKIDPVTGRLVWMWMNGGGSGTSNPFDVVNTITNNEDTWRQIGNVRVGYSALSTTRNNVQVTYIGGVDRFQTEGRQYSPNYEQFEAADGFLGTANVLSAESRFFNQSINGVWTYTPGFRWVNSAQSSVGGTLEKQTLNNYEVRQRGLLPSRVVANGGTDILTADAVQQFIDQSQYVNEQIIALDEKLALSAGVRADRGSENGDRAKYYTYPKYSASYRFTEPLAKLTSKVDEVKLRASFGQSGNRPRYGDRDITITGGGVIGGNNSLVAASAVGNPTVRPEVMNEKEFGVDAGMFGGRVSLEASHYERVIKDLLVTYPLAPASGLGTETINGGQMSTRGFEAGLNIAPISTRDVEWTLRTTYQHNTQRIDQLSVPKFAVPNSFGSSYGRNYIALGLSPTLIWGRVPFSCINTRNGNQVIVGTGADGLPCHRVSPSDANFLAGGKYAGTTTSVDSVIADANPRGQTSFLNTVRYKRVTVSALLDWRNGGYTADMTKNLFDEGGNSHDYDAASPIAGQTLGQWRYGSFAAHDIATYIDDGTYVKLRELNVSFEAPKRWADLARAGNMRVEVQGRNLYMWSKYWSFDPEFNNFGNQNFNRFIDLAPYPSMRQFFVSVSLGY